MNTLLQFILIAVCLMVLTGIILAWAAGFRAKPLIFSNVVPGTVARHPGVVTRKLEAALAARKLLVRQGTDDDQILVGTTAKPMGVVDDVGEIGDRVAVSLLGSALETLVMTASGAIAAGDDVYAAADGKVSTLPAGVGTYYFVGVALTAAAADGDEIEVDPSAPRAVTV